MRILGLDLGERRIGVAAADDAAPIAIPLTTLTVIGDPLDAIARLAADEHAGEVVVGLPLSMSGVIGPQAERVMAHVRALEERLSIPVRTWDERLTTVEAGHRAKSAARRTRTRRRPDDSGNKDAIAASIMLQAYLDSRKT